MVMRTDPFRDLDRLSHHLYGGADRPSAMPMDAYRRGDRFFVHFDIPGVDAASIDLTVDKNVLTVEAERLSAASDAGEAVVVERPTGPFSRQLFLGDSLDGDRIEASYEGGVLTLVIPIHEAAKPRKIAIASGDHAGDVSTD